MQNKTMIQIPFDIRNILPNINEQVKQEELIGKVPINQFIEKADEINQLHLGNAGDLHEDISHIIQVDDSNLKAIGLGCLTGIHTFNGNYKKAIASINQALNLNTDEEVYAYVLTEYANLLRQLRRLDEALAILDQAMQLTTNEKLKWRILTYKGFSIKYTNTEQSLDILKQSLRYYFDEHELPRYTTIMRHIATIYLFKKKYNDAEKYYKEIINLAKRYSYKSIEHGAMNDFGWLLTERGKQFEAVEIFNQLLKCNKGPYLDSLVLQNLAFIEFESKNYLKAIEYHNQSIKITSKNEIYEMIFEDYYKLGLCHEKIGEYDKAEKYYQEGYHHLLSERKQTGIILNNGYRGLLMENYLRLLSSKPTIKHVSMHPSTFDFINDKTYNEILAIFQKHLLSLHRDRLKTVKELCKELDISMRLYFVYQKRFDLSKSIINIDTVKNEHFKNYLYSLINYDWRSAIKKFDSDLFSYLLKIHNYNKTKIAEVLDVSILTVINKTVDIDN